MLFRNIGCELPALFLTSLSLVSAAPVHKLERRCQDYDPSLPLHAESLSPDGDQVVPLRVPFLDPKGHQGDLVKSIKGELVCEFAPTSRVLQKANYNDYWDGVPLDPDLSASGSAYDSLWFDNTGGVGRVCIDPPGGRARSGTVNIRLPGQEPDSARYPHDLNSKRLFARSLTQMPGLGEAIGHLEQLKAFIESGMPMPPDSDHNPVSYMDHLASLGPRRKPASRRPWARYPSERRRESLALQYNPVVEHSPLSHTEVPNAKTLQPPKEKSAFKRPQIRRPTLLALEPAGASQNAPNTKHGIPLSGVEHTIQWPRVKSPYYRLPRVRYPQGKAEGPAVIEDEIVVSVTSAIPISAATIPDADPPTTSTATETDTETAVAATTGAPPTDTATATGPTVTGTMCGSESIGPIVAPKGLAPAAVYSAVGAPSVTTALAVEAGADGGGCSR